MAARQPPPWRGENAGAGLVDAGISLPLRARC